MDWALAIVVNRLPTKIFCSDFGLTNVVRELDDVEIFFPLPTPFTVGAAEIVVVGELDKPLILCVDSKLPSFFDFGNGIELLPVLLPWDPC